MIAMRRLTNIFSASLVLLDVPLFWEESDIKPRAASEMSLCIKWRRAGCLCSFFTLAPAPNTAEAP